LLLLLVVKIVAIAHNPPHPYPPWNGVTIYPPLSRPLFLVGCCVCRVSNINIGHPLNNMCCHSSHHPTWWEDIPNRL
jgi:hypothetical protein